MKLFPHFSLLFTRCLLLFARCLLLSAWSPCFLPVACYFLLVACYFLFVINYFLLKVKGTKNNKNNFSLKSFTLLLSYCNAFVRVWRVTYYCPVFPFYTPWKHKKTVGFLMFSVGIKREHWAVMGWSIKKLVIRHG